MIGASERDLPPLERRHAFAGQLVGALVVIMAGVALHPVPRHLVQLQRVKVSVQRVQHPRLIVERAHPLAPFHAVKREGQGHELDGNAHFVQVRTKPQRRGSLLEVRVHPEDLGRVIGRSGRTATALRTVIKALADFPNVVYLLAFDRDVAAQAIEQQGGLPGARYLEKIVQVSFKVPRPEAFDLRRWFHDEV